MPDAKIHASCLPPETLRQFLANELSDELESSVLAHLESCPRCQELCDSVARSDHLGNVRSKLAHLNQEREPTAVAALRNELYGIDDTVSQPGESDTQTQAYSPTSVDGVLPRSFGGYELLEEIARGGMGVVYKARQIKLDRIVAVKMILAGEFASADGIRRFMTEAQAAANLDHPHIVPIYEVGEHAGRHFYSMGYVEGQSLAKLVAHGPLPPREAAELMRRIAEAVQYAHAKGVIHRDLKPQNVLLDRAGAPRVTDFGLAKRVQGDSELTSTGQVLGTPSYMPPEQARGDLLSIGPHTDIYSLGAILYCLMTGRPPFQTASVMDTLKQVLERDPVPPRQLNPGVPRDLDTICLKCLEKEPAKRYGGAALLIEDLRRYLAGEPVRARPIPPHERLARWARRYPARAALVATVICSAVLSVAGLLVHSARLDEVNQQLTVQIDKTADALKQSRESEQNATKNEKVALRTAADSTLSRALSVCDQGDVAAGLLWLVRAADLAERAGDHELGEAVRLNLAAWSREIYTLSFVAQARASRISSLAAHPDGRRVAAGCFDGQVLIWDVIDGKADGAALPHPGEVNALVFTPDGDTLITGCSDGSIRRWDLATREVVGELWQHPSKGEQSFQTPKRTGVRDLALAANGPLLASAGSSDIRLWDLQTGMPAGAPITLAGLALGVAFSGDGQRVWAAAQDGTVRSWSVATRTEIGPPYRIYAYAISLVAHPDRAEAIAGYDSARVVRIDEHGTAIQPPLLVGRPAHDLAVDHQGGLLATACADGRLLLWDANSGSLVNSSLRHDSSLFSTCFLTGSKGVVSGADSGALRYWRAPQAGPRVAIRTPFLWARQACFSPDGGKVVVSAMGATNAWPVMYETGTGNKIEVKWPVAGLGRKEWQSGVGFAADGRIVSAEGARHFYRWNPSTGEANVPVDTEQALWRMGVSADGRRLITGSTTFASTSYKNAARVWDIASGTPVGKPLEHKGTVWGLALSADGELAVTGSDDHDAALWDMKTGELIGDKRQHPSAIKAVAISNDRKRVLTGCEDGFARLWVIPGWLTTQVSMQHTSAVLSVDFSPDSRLLFTASADGKARLWHAATGRPIGSAWAHNDRVNVIRCHPDGTAALTAADDGHVRIWPIASAWTDPISAMMRRVESLTGLRLEENGSIHALSAAEWHERAIASEPLHPSHAGSLEQIERTDL